MSRLVDIMIAAARAAGAEIERIYGAGCATEWKPDGSPVTQADHAAEAIILDQLSRAYRDVPVVAEEEASAGRVPNLAARWFLVDPLDGTRGFVERNGEFTVNIALIELGLPIAGVIYAPDSHLLYAGARGEGAWCSRDGGQLEPVQPRDPPAAGLTAIASRADPEATRARIAHLPMAELLPSSSSLKFCLLADGSADLYPRFGRTMEWDTGAGQAILEAAGGRVLALDADGRETGPLRYGKPGFENPHFLAWAR